jgi:hypothetical protein
MAGRHARHGQRGQALVIMVLATTALLAMVAMIADGGYAWAQLRIAQNGADSAAEGGATVLSERHVGVDKSSAQWDADVHEAVVSNWEANITHPTNSVVGYYTDICGTLLQPSGAMASGPGNAAVVGGGALPAEPNDSTPVCSATPNSVGPVAGVNAIGTQDFPTFVAGIVGITSFSASAQATAVTGFLQSCNVTADQNCVILPIAFPVNLVSCDKSGKSVVSGIEVPYDVELVLPICKYNGGNFGFVDWSPPNGGESELISCINDPIQSNCFPGGDVPLWLAMAQSGNPSSSTLEAAVNAWEFSKTHQTILVPLFDAVCKTLPASGTANCPTNDLNGTPQYYHAAKFGRFELEHAYLSGNAAAECNPDWSPDGGSTDCVIGTFRSFISSGPVFSYGPGGGSNGEVGVQLIK